MQTQTAETFRQVLDELATRFGETGEALWQSLITYEVTTAIASMIAIPILIAIFLVISPKLMRISEKYHGDDEVIEVMAGIVSVVTAIIGVVLLVVWVASIPEIMGSILAPEAAVIRDLLGASIMALPLTEQQAGWLRRRLAKSMRGKADVRIVGSRGSFYVKAVALDDAGKPTHRTEMYGRELATRRRRSLRLS